ncbi:DUF3108 domain-containing protein [Massilia sp. CCM 8734]|uniref:DUF3108 domain-containing protein n=1 Tax=Massilia sp. CCM 8734 TaxID=2609283 RepID=UPI00141F05B9|nr:DUF3108 domain-containing protein [Massilia sp. CCM 8734]NHZ96775.1 DUF3108 domain-containing protein [Massilia sp. CCM 8734]
MRPLFTQLLGGAVLASACAGIFAAEHEAVLRPFNLAPSADLHYTLKARQKGLALAGEAQVTWRAGDGKYSLVNETRAQMLGKILESRSEGTVDTYGIAPAQFVEKRFRKEATTATFDRGAKTLSFSAGKDTFPLLGGEQDRSSAQWQLAALARAQPDKFTPGSEWRLFVAGRKDAQPWSFKVIKREKIATGLGEVEAVHLSKAPPPGDKDQTVDLWLAPGHDWYPVQLRYSDEEGEFIEQTVDKINKK